MKTKSVATSGRKHDRRWRLRILRWNFKDVKIAARRSVESGEEDDHRPGTWTRRISNPVLV